MKINSIKNLLEIVKTAGKIASEEQEKIKFSDRKYKNDNSVLTEVDIRVEGYLLKEISRLYPEANILTEETKSSFDPEKPYTFTIDPIDGTDSYSQGLPGWSISIGLLDKKLTPIAGIIFAPKWGSLFFSDVGKKTTHNGKKILPGAKIDISSSKSNILVSSSIHKYIDLKKFKGKIRSFGSTALHLCFPLIYQGIIASVTTKIYIWDLVAAHAINNSMGYNLEYLNGEKIDYLKIIDGSPTEDIILSGTKKVIEDLRNILIRI